jgi:o-succinylbenzoate synthase
MRNTEIKIDQRILDFKTPAGTSRGVYKIRTIWLITIKDKSNPDHFGIGECAPLPDLSCDYNQGYEDTLRYFCHKIQNEDTFDFEELRPYPSIKFGIETAFRQYERNDYALWDTPFSRGEKGILTNGLIWMGSIDYMTKQAEEKIKAGFSCIKLKIGAQNFEDEYNILKQIRKRYSADRLTIRVDANGAFSLSDALIKMKRLNELQIHSIEQPIKSGNPEILAEIIKKSQLPVALDEELIGVNTKERKAELLDIVKPDYIVLKPSLHGGFSGCEEWIDIAEKMNIGWWITSALESNIGLNAIAQWCAKLDNDIHHGLGTGKLFKNNINMPLEIIGEKLWYKP